MNADSRYAESWPTVSRAARAKTGGKCVLCEGKATLVHHACYRDLFGAIAGREVAGLHVFPLCAKCHGVAHSKRNWRGNSNKTLRRNGTLFRLKLAISYLLVR